VGLQRANWLAMLGEKLDANRAKEWGLIYDVSRHRHWPTRASIWRAASRRCRPRLGLIKRGFNASARNDLEAQLALEVELQREAGSSDDYAEGVRAFVEKRKPRFQGR
jgi:2-(1,2-epoxy-1,2-dihydrophenyl)acetyl-CoA isomerase